MEAINDEFDRFERHGVFQVAPAAEMPMHYKALSSVWTLKQKANGIFRARLTMVYTIVQHGHQPLLRVQ